MPDLSSLRERLDALPVEPSQLVAAVVVAVALVVGAVSALGHRSRPPVESALPRAAPAPPEAAPDVVAHAAGAVARPGVQRLPLGARVADLLDAAGGVTADADLDQVNLAAKVSDGDRIYVPRRGEAPPPVAAGQLGAEGPVNLNTATVEQFDALPGVGPSTAAAIVEHRTRNGRFRTVDDLGQVPGIGPARLAALRPKVRV